MTSNGTPVLASTSLCFPRPFPVVLYSPLSEVKKLVVFHTWPVTSNSLSHVQQARVTAEFHKQRKLLLILPNPGVETWICEDVKIWLRKTLRIGTMHLRTDWDMQSTGIRQMDSFCKLSFMETFIPAYFNTIVQTLQSSQRNDCYRYSYFYLLTIASAATDSRLPSFHLLLFSMLANDQNSYAPVNRKCGWNVDSPAEISTPSCCWLPIPARKLIFRSEITQTQIKSRQSSIWVFRLRCNVNTCKITVISTKRMWFKPQTYRPLFQQNTENSDIKKGQHTSHAWQVYLRTYCIYYMNSFFPHAFRCSSLQVTIHVSLFVSPPTILHIILPLKLFDVALNVSHCFIFGIILIPSCWLPHSNHPYDIQSSLDSSPPRYDIHVCLFHHITLSIFEIPRYMAMSTTASQPNFAPAIRNLDAFKHWITRTVRLWIDPGNLGEVLYSVDSKTRRLVPRPSHCRSYSLEPRHCVFMLVTCFPCLHCAIRRLIWSCPAHAALMSSNIRCQRIQLNRSNITDSFLDQKVATLKRTTTSLPFIFWSTNLPFFFVMDLSAWKHFYEHLV